MTDTMNQTQAAASAKPAPIQKMCFILSKATLDNVYACLVMANGARMEGIEADIFFTFFGLEAVNKSRMEHLHVATVGNPAMHIPTILGGLPGMETLATSMMKKEMEKLDMPSVPEFLEILSASGAGMYACKLAMDMFHLEKEDLFDGIEDVLTIGEFYARAAGEGTHIVFI
ncbi:MAG: DsrE/DsrF/DrsH-like family protein [Saprospiraceae bacterium]